MAHNDNFAGAAPIAPFDAARWFAEWSDHGGIVILTDERLFVSRIATLDRKAAQHLNTLREQIISHPDAANALASLMRANAGEAVACHP